MVSFWPFKGEDSSPASFEKALSALSTKITNTQAQLDAVHKNSRRVRVLYTLYLSFAYLVYAIILMLVVGWQNLGPLEWTGMASGPVFIYLIRTGTNAYFTWRIEALEARLKDRQAERTATIGKLKAATKYDSTLELLEKYGGEKRPKLGRQGTGDQDDKSGHPKTRGGPRHSLPTPGSRTGLGPPATANIQRPSSSGALTPTAPQQPSPHQGSPSGQLQQAREASVEDFAPNAGHVSNAHVSSNQYDLNPGPPRWYDRMMDLMLGDDETAPKNRIVLICARCRLVNGQAPPGTRTLHELGQWKCMGCGTMNGEMDEGKKIMREVLGGDKRLARELEKQLEQDGSPTHQRRIREEDGPSEVFKSESDTSSEDAPELKSKTRGAKKS
ncbi:endoplasmic reticulum junction formation protein lunapark [Microdochium nivale]|nr:endoplasmic reticulum junction formation protein lunapark [Microdochium nivale]